MFDLETSIKNWLKQFQKHQAFNQGSMHEMELHLRDHIEDLISEGNNEQKAFQMAVIEFGEVPEMAKEAYSTIKTKATMSSFIYTKLLNNYFKTTTRHMLKNPLTSFINVFGLAVAIGACMVTYAFINFDLSTDRHHEYKDEVYLSTFYLDREGKIEQHGNLPIPLGAMLRNDFTAINKVCRIQDGNMVVKFDDKVFHERARYVEPEFLEMFTFPLKEGHAESLNDLNSVILSDEMSNKYFEGENPIGKEIKLIVNDDNFKSFKVSGVAEPFPKAHIIDFDFLLNLENYKTLNAGYDFRDWGKMSSATFIQVKDPNDLVKLKDDMIKFKKVQNAAEPDWPIDSFDFVSLHDLHLVSDEIRNDISFDGAEEGRIALPFIACFFLALACFSYINIAIVSASKRLKEIGLRKVIGANRKQVIFQFVSENLVLTFFAAIIGFILAITLFLPWFSSFSDITSEFNFQDGRMWAFLFGLLTFTGIVSGLYPALYISKFDVVKIFKGSVKFGQKNTLTKVFLTIQLVIACIGIAFAVMFAQNSSYQSEREWGYNQNEAIYVHVENESTFQKLNHALSQNSNIVSISGSENHLAIDYNTTIVHLPDNQIEVQQIGVDANYFETMELQLSSGRTFYKNQESEFKSIIVNELFVKNLSLEDPIGHITKINLEQFQIIGVVKDFHFNNFYYKNKPAIFILSKPEQYRFLTAKFHKGTKISSYDEVEKAWANLFPETPFQGGFQEDTWGGFYEDLGVMHRFTRAIAIVFVLLASLGLYGLVQLNIAGRIREFSIRKTLGANTVSLAKNIFSQYLVIFSVAVLLGVPLGHFLNTAMLDLMFPDPRPFGYTGSILAACILVFVLLGVITTQVRRVSNSNPVEGLKIE